MLLHILGVMSLNQKETVSKAIKTVLYAAPDIGDGPCSGVWGGLNGGSTEVREKTR